MVKLNIQRFSSTNKTTNYDLSQFVSSDKPSWLNDYNGDMGKIDTAIHTAKTTADGAATAASNAQTAAEGAQTTANTAVTNAATADSKAETAQTRIGTLANLTTTEKTTIVGAINEVDGNCDSNTAKIGTLANLSTPTKTDIVDSINSAYTEMKGTQLYYNANGTNQNITLSESIANYKRIVVLTKNWYFDEYDVYTLIDINGKNTHFTSGYITNGTYFVVDTHIVFNGTSVIYGDSYSVNTTSWPTTSATITSDSAVRHKIVEIIGYDY